MKLEVRFVLILITALLVAIDLALHCIGFLTNEDQEMSRNRNENNIVVAGGDAEKPEVSTPEIRNDFDMLMHFVHHPKAKCNCIVILGGHKHRGGTKIDGDKAVCLDPARKLVKPCIVYSFGINNEWSFDEAIQKNYGCKVYAFDPSMTPEDHLHSTDIWFYRMGISNNDKDRVYTKEKIWKMNTFEGIKKKLGHANDQKIDVVKMDIEGSEFSVLENMLDRGMLKNVNHLCVEIHLSAVPRQWKRVYRILKRIEEAGLHLFSVRNNTITGYGKVPGEENRKEYLFFEAAWFRY